MHIQLKVFLCIFIGLLALAVFWDLSGNDYVSQMGLAGCIFFLDTFLIMQFLGGSLLTFQAERPVFLRE